MAEAGEKVDTQTGFSKGDVPPCTGPGPPIPPPADPQNRRKEGPGLAEDRSQVPSAPRPHKLTMRDTQRPKQIMAR